MSRVTIRELYSEDDYIIDYDEAIKNIEIVPRKMVEMIIEKCDVMKLQTIDNDYEKSVVRFNACNSLKEYAESLFKQFEEEKE